MSPASYLTAPPRGAPWILAAVRERAGRAWLIVERCISRLRPVNAPLDESARRDDGRKSCISPKSRDDSGGAARAPSRHADFDPAGSAPAHVASVDRLDFVSCSTPADPLVALLAAIRRGARAGVSVRRRRSVARGGPVAIRGVELLHPRAALVGGAVQRHRVLRAAHAR